MSLVNALEFRTLQDHNIDESERIAWKIQNLIGKEKVRYRDQLKENLYSSFWCSVNRVNYVNPNMRLVKELTYLEMFEKE